MVIQLIALFAVNFVRSIRIHTNLVVQFLVVLAALLINTHAFSQCKSELNIFIKYYAKS